MLQKAHLPYGVHGNAGEAYEIGGIYMRRLLILTVAACLLSACASRNFEPQTLQGAQCKLDCIDRASVMLLGASYGRCMEACIDLDRLYKARQATAQ